MMETGTKIASPPVSLVFDPTSEQTPETRASQTVVEPVSPPEPQLVIRPGGIGSDYWAELWRYRELFYFLAWRDLKVRYKQTVIGIAWAVIRPLLTMVIFTVLFGRLAGLPSPDDI